MERLVERENMTLAFEKVCSNKGAPGCDGMELTDLEPYLQRQWSTLKSSLLGSNYYPEAVLQVEIRKESGGTRKLGIPTVVDRLIQQGLHQILSPLFDPHFSDHSYGFRPGKSAEQAVVQSQQYILQGYNWVVDMDLEKFFDEVSHDVLMGKVMKKVQDKAVLRLIRRYLEADVMINGKREVRRKGVPQGGPLSPLLSNILLDDLDKELEKRGHRFCRYADDCNIYVRSARAGERVKESLTEWLRKRLKLKVNEAKSAVARPWKRSFLGFTFLADKLRRITVAKKSIKRFKGKVKELLRKGKGRNLGRFIEEDLNPLIRGWINYFRAAQTKRFAQDLDEWIRHHLRKIIWRQWKRNWTRYEGLMSRGLPEDRARQSAFNGRGPWWNSGASHMNHAFRKSYFKTLKLVSMEDQLNYWKANV
ncbi:MAG: group II intron reverse transcriptase/maturase [Bacteroidia bacterium]|nr:group II intron reverse transcriptase/maturase [Bacteroidia bacterium]MCB9235225.1 group II intron reverse transcriptase/maturase [Bacteroidia bacterium]MCB9235446.1 group II intron reverse transcriptase/maturase [Bacteroidia bacterium]MCB9235883.1 group II intron reverse transcriptase/maturase [Bacteroidia bacterium]MCB9235953.1 group II intron reverse transcriptase/maturase [Bacteroidia bacterium]